MKPYYRTWEWLYNDPSSNKENIKNNYLKYVRNVKRNRKGKRK